MLTPGRLTWAAGDVNERICRQQLRSEIGGHSQTGVRSRTKPRPGILGTGSSKLEAGKQLETRRPNWSKWSAWELNGFGKRLKIWSGRRDSSPRHQASQYRRLF